MPKNKISEFSSTPANNTDIAGINIAEGCAPSGINNAIRELMAQLKDQQSGTDGDDFTVGGNLTVTGTATGSTPSVSDDSTKFATTAFVRDIIPSGVIVMWSGSVATIPSGWYLCDGNNSTPDLRNRFIVGAGSTYSVAGTGGSADAIVVSHTHTADSAGAATGSISANIGSDFGSYQTGSASGVFSVSGSSLPNRMQGAGGTGSRPTVDMSIPAHTHTINSTGSSGTNANLPPYYALAYIMKA
jgi:microcystin-dependent protein